MFSELHSIRWHELRLTLRNDRNTFARQHPLAVVEAVLRGTAGKQCPPEPEPWFFRPSQPFGQRVRVGAHYSMAVVFPVSSAETVAAFATRLHDYLQDSKHNFSLTQVGAATERSLGQVEEETRGLDAAATTELCLDFLTPLAFTPADPSRRWLLRLPDLLQGLANRVRSFWGVPLAWPANALEGLELLPCCWDYVEYGRASKSKGGWQLINGCVGPLFLKGDLRPWLALLRLGAAIGVDAPGGGRGVRRAFGYGAYRLDDRRPYFSAAWRNPDLWRSALEELAAESNDPDPVLHPLDVDVTVRELMEEVLCGKWRPEPARLFPLDKKPGAKASSQEPVRQRLVAQFSSRDRVVHRALLRLLSAAWDRLFESCSQGYRPDRSPATARALVLGHIRKGCGWALEADVADFFDSVDWDLLDHELNRSLPAGDGDVAETLRRIVRAPLTLNGEPVARERGLPQGCALSPLLANLYLDPFDEAATRAGLRLVRYADDFLILCQSEAEADEAGSQVAALLANRKLTLQPEKLAITPLGGGFHFLGLGFAPELEEEFVERSLLRRPVYVLSDYSFIGTEGETLICRVKGRLSAQVPLRRAGEVLVYGPHSVSTELLRRCARQNIAVGFCTAAGHHVATLRPDSKAHFELTGLHFARRTQLALETATRIAAEIVDAKLGNYVAWLRQTAEGRTVAERLRETISRLSSVASVESVLGLEGEAARHTFRFVNDQVRKPGFASKERAPRRKYDSWNSLLDFVYTRLFTRLNVLARARGLNPYLGFLHSPQDNFESLVCDLQEPFRARCDRWAVKQVNLGTVATTDFAPHPYGGIR